MDGYLLPLSEQLPGTDRRPSGILPPHHPQHPTPSALPREIRPMIRGQQYAT